MSEETVEKIKDILSYIVIIIGTLVVVLSFTVKKSDYDECVERGANESYCFRLSGYGWEQ